MTNWINKFEETWNSAPDWWRLTILQRLAKICVTKLEVVEQDIEDYKQVVGDLGDFIEGKSFSCLEFYYTIDNNGGLGDNSPNLAAKCEELSTKRAVILGIGVVNFCGAAGRRIARWLNIEKELRHSLELGDFDAISMTIEQLVEIDSTLLPEIQACVDTAPDFSSRV